FLNRVPSSLRRAMSGDAAALRIAAMNSCRRILFAARFPQRLSRVRWLRPRVPRSQRITKGGGQRVNPVSATIKLVSRLSRSGQITILDRSTLDSRASKAPRFGGAFFYEPSSGSQAHFGR